MKQPGEQSGAEEAAKEWKEKFIYWLTNDRYINAPNANIIADHVERYIRQASLNQNERVQTASFHEQDDMMYCSHCNQPIGESVSKPGEVEESYPGQQYQRLFDYLHGMWKGTALVSEMQDIIQIVHEDFPSPQTSGAVWELRQAVIENLMDADNVDEKYLAIGKNVYTRRTLAKEISDQTTIGNQVISNLINLTIDLCFKGQTKTYPNPHPSIKGKVKERSWLKKNLKPLIRLWNEKEDLKQEIERLNKELDHRRGVQNIEIVDDRDAEIERLKGLMKSLHEAGTMCTLILAKFSIEKATKETEIAWNNYKTENNL